MDTIVPLGRAGQKMVAIFNNPIKFVDHDWDVARFTRVDVEGERCKELDCFGGNTGRKDRQHVPRKER